MASFPSLTCFWDCHPHTHTAQTLSQDPSPGGHGCACLTWKGPRILPSLTRPPPLPGSHSSSPRAFSPAGTPTLMASGLCSPAPAPQTLVTLSPSLGRHPSSSVPDATSDPGLPRFLLLVSCVGELKIASATCALPGKDLVFPGVGPQGTDEVLLTNAPAFGPVLSRRALFPRLGRLDVHCVPHSLCDCGQSTWPLSASVSPSATGGSSLH